MINDLEIEKISTEFLNAKPFNHYVIDNFFKEDIANSIADEFYQWNDPVWSHFYSNPVEVKKLLNHWDKFKKTSYLAFTFLNSNSFLDILKKITKNRELTTDIGLHGGGYHCHSKGGKLNVHLDYDTHPKLNLQRKLNLIIYVSKEWKSEWGGGLGLWSGNKDNLVCEKVIDIKFNRAVLFDTTQNSWHGLPDPINCPENVGRNSLAIYYLEPLKKLNDRYRALFIPSDSQRGDSKIQEFCIERSKL